MDLIAFQARKKFLQIGGGDFVELQTELGRNLRHVPEDIAELFFYFLFFFF